MPKTLVEIAEINALRPGGVSFDLWVGLGDAETEFLYRWYDGTPISDWSIWANGEPDFFGAENNDCGWLGFVSDLIQEVDCTQGAQFVCEPLAPLCSDSDSDGYGEGCEAGFDCAAGDSDRHTLVTGYPDVDQDGTTTGARVYCTDGSLPSGVFATPSDNVDCDDRVASGELDCDGHFTRTLKNGLCLRFYDDSVPHDDAVDSCEAGTLVHVKDIERQFIIGAELASLGWNEVWIGLTANDDEWIWPDGSTLVFDGWWGNEPSSGNEGCVRFHRDRGWKDESCATRSYRYVCEAPCADLQPIEL